MYGKRVWLLKYAAVNFYQKNQNPNMQTLPFILASVSFWPLSIIELVPRSVPARLIIR